MERLRALASRPKPLYKPRMTAFATQLLPAEPTVIAPDGSDVRVLLSLAGGGMAHFELAAGQVARAVVHRTVEEIWYVVSGRGQMWRSQDGREETVDLHPGVCLSIPVGTRFQFRAAPAQALATVAVTLPPWPGDGEAVVVTGPWQPS
jgi:mannose-6-phosphate isomerase-like protein (cupin superfamily)